jgi:hypothetical protein
MIVWFVIAFIARERGLVLRLFELPLMSERYTRAVKLKMRLWSQVQCSRTVGNDPSGRSLLGLPAPIKY